MKVPKPGERMRSHPLYRVKTKPPVVFDDQRPGWDSTSRDLDKYKLTDEQVDVSATIHPRAANPNVSAPTSIVERFQIQPPTHTQSDHHPTKHPTQRRRVANNSSARTSPRPGKSSARVRTPPPSSSTRGTHRASPRSIPPNRSAASSTKPTAATDRERTNHHHRPRSGGVTWPREEAAWAPCASPR